MSSSVRSPSHGFRKSQARRGSVLVLAAVMMVVMLAMLAMSVDLGYLLSLQTDLKRSTDAAALAGAGVLVEGGDAAELQAFEFLVRNPVGKKCLAGDDEDWQENLEAHLDANRDDVAVEVGYWNPQTTDNPQTPQDERFAVYDASVPGATPPSAIRVQAFYRDVPFFVGSMFRPRERVYDENGMHEQAKQIDINCESIARYQPRDIMLVLDFSGSMNDDSELKRISEAPSDQKAAVKAIIEDNLELMDNELQAIPSPPNLGTLPFTPAWPVLHGQPASGAIPHCTVQFGTDTYGYKSVYVTSTKDLSNVVIETDNGYQQKFEPLSGYSGTFKGTVTNQTKDRRITKVWVKSGSNASDDGPGYGERFVGDCAGIKKAFGLDTVAYPYASGSWDTYLSYAQTSSHVNSAGCKWKYGRMTLINYWLENKYAYNHTNALWRLSAQPVTALKDGVDVFMQYINEVDTKDRVGLVIYNSSGGNALVEHALTYDFDCVATTTRQRQAGHYDAYTNIGAGIQYARQHLEAQGRTGAFKMIVLMTDGQANKPTDEATARALVLSEAQLVAAHRWPIITISLGNSADTALMQQVADMTYGTHFNLPAGESITNFTAQLLAAFRRIADHRPLTLVK